MRDILRRALGWKASESAPAGSGGDILRWALRWLSAPVVVDAGKLDVALADSAVTTVALSDYAATTIALTDTTRD